MTDQPNGLPGVTERLGAEGAPYPMPLPGGRVLYLSRLTRRRKSAVEMWLLERAKADAAEDRRRLSLSDAVYADLLSRINDRHAARHYAFGGEAYQQAMRTEDGICFVLRLLLAEKQPTLTDDDAYALIDDHPAEVNAALAGMAVGELQRKGLPVPKELLERAKPPPSPTVLTASSSPP
jgi:hypothetical protein